MKGFSVKQSFFLICLNAALYALIVALDIRKAAYGLSHAEGFLCDACKYAAIISCLLICIFAFARTQRPAARVQTVVFAITLAADFFLLFTPFFVAGVFIFLGAHLCALLRYRQRWVLPAGLCSAAIFAIIMRFAPPLLHVDAKLALLIAACAAYAVLIISVTLSTFFARQPRTNAMFSRVGMLLFIACDINVAVFNALPEGSPPHTASTVLMWLFYLPAQTLLALSATDLPPIQKK